MPYNIEVTCLGTDQYALLERAAAGLNGVQDQFRFEVTQVSQREAGLSFRRDEYFTEEVWEFLSEQRKYGAPRQFIIAFVSRPLASERLSNLFGSHRGKDGLAVVTNSDSSQYVKEDERYCRYYMVRYAMSFVNWLVKVHDDDERADCYFNKKMDKREIALSMNSGNICDVCRSAMDNPPEGSSVHRLTDRERSSLEAMRLFVSGDYPYSLVLKGGGIKGLAFASALVELGKYFSFNRHVGTSAGSIAAALLSANFKPAELQQILEQKDFKDFLDARWWALPFNLVFRKGLYPGEHFRHWIAELLTSKLGLQSEVRMEHLDGAIVYAARAGQGALTYDSCGPRRETVASFAVRCSMSIPFFFQPVTVDGRLVFDGGLRNNFPLKRFLDSFKDAPFIAIYLGRPDNSNQMNVVSSLLDIVVDGEEKELVDNHTRDVVIIDTYPIGTVDFRLSKTEKDFLLAAGRASALEFLRRRNIELGPSTEMVSTARAKTEALRAEVISARNEARRRRWKRLVFLVLTGLAALTFWWMR